VESNKSRNNPRNNSYQNYQGRNYNENSTQKNYNGKLHNENYNKFNRNNIPNNNSNKNYQNINNNNHPNYLKFSNINQNIENRRNSLKYPQNTNEDIQEITKKLAELKINVCINCQRIGHIVDECPELENSEHLN